MKLMRLYKDEMIEEIGGHVLFILAFSFCLQRMRTFLVDCRLRYNREGYLLKYGIILNPTLYRGGHRGPPPEGFDLWSLPE